VAAAGADAAEAPPSTVTGVAAQPGPAAPALSSSNTVVDLEREDEVDWLDGGDATALDWHVPPLPSIAPALVGSLLAGSASPSPPASTARSAAAAGSVTGGKEIDARLARFVATCDIDKEPPPVAAPPTPPEAEEEATPAPLPPSPPAAASRRQARMLGLTGSDFAHDTLSSSSDSEWRERSPSRRRIGGPEDGSPRYASGGAKAAARPKAQPAALLTPAAAVAGASGRTTASSSSGCVDARGDDRAAESHTAEMWSALKERAQDLVQPHTSRASSPGANAGGRASWQPAAWQRGGGGGGGGSGGGGWCSDRGSPRGPEAPCTADFGRFRDDRPPAREPLRLRPGPEDRLRSGDDRRLRRSRSNRRRCLRSRTKSSPTGGSDWRGGGGSAWNQESPRRLRDAGHTSRRTGGRRGAR